MAGGDTDGRERTASTGSSKGRGENPDGQDAAAGDLKPRDGKAEEWGKVLGGGGYLALRYGAGAVLSLINVLLLSRLVGPRAFGLFAAAVGLSTIFSALARMGLDGWLVRVEAEPGAQEYRQVLTLMLVASAAVVVCGLGAAGAVGWWYGDGDFVPPYVALVAAAPLATLAGPAIAKLERAQKFRAVAGIELSGQATAVCVAAPAAFAGWGVWAPVAGYVAWQVVVLAQAWWRAGVLPGISFSKKSAREMLRYGMGHAAGVRVWQLRSLVNPLIVGRVVGPEGVAYVALALRAAETLGFVRAAAGRVALAALGKWRGDRARMHEMMVRAQAAQMAVLGGMLCAFAAAGPWLVPRMLGARWEPVMSVFPFVAVGVLAHGYFQIPAAGMLVLGRPWVVTRAYAAGGVLLVVAAAMLVPRMGIEGYGWAEIAACAGFAVIAREGRREFRGKRELWWVIIFVVGVWAPMVEGVWKIVVLGPSVVAGVVWGVRWMVGRRREVFVEVEGGGRELRESVGARE